MTEVAVESIVTEKHLIFLDKLRESGVTNMYGATPYLQKAFGLSWDKGVKILAYWMKTFEERHKEDSSEKDL